MSEPIRLDRNLGAELANGGGEWNDLNDVRVGVEDALGDNHDGWMTESGVTPCWLAEVELNDVTRGQHRATRPHPA